MCVCVCVCVCVCARARARACARMIILAAYATLRYLFQISSLRQSHHSAILEMARL